MNTTGQLGIHNKFNIEVKDSRTSEIKGSYVAHNLITNKGLEQLAQGSIFFDNIILGSGSIPPSVANSSMPNRLLAKTCVLVEINQKYPVSSVIKKIVLNPEDLVGKSITQVGLGAGQYSSDLYTQAQIKDAEGNPIQLLKTETDIITIYATVFVNFIQNDDKLTFLLDPQYKNIYLYRYLGGNNSLGLSVSKIAAINSRYLIKGNGMNSQNYEANKTYNLNNRTYSVKTRLSTNQGNNQTFYNFRIPDLCSVELPHPTIFTGFKCIDRVLDKDLSKSIYPIKDNFAKDLSLKVNNNIFTNFNVHSDKVFEQVFPSFYSENFVWVDDNHLLVFNSQDKQVTLVKIIKGKSLQIIDTVECNLPNISLGSSIHPSLSIAIFRSSSNSVVVVHFDIVNQKLKILFSSNEASVVNKITPDYVGIRTGIKYSTIRMENGLPVVKSLDVAQPTDKLIYDSLQVLGSNHYESRLLTLKGNKAILIYNRELYWAEISSEGILVKQDKVFNVRPWKGDIDSYRISFIPETNELWIEDDKNLQTDGTYLHRLLKFKLNLDLKTIIETKEYNIQMRSNAPSLLPKTMGLNNTYLSVQGILTLTEDGENISFKHLYTYNDQKVSLWSGVHSRLFLSRDKRTLLIQLGNSGQFYPNIFIWDDSNSTYKESIYHYKDFTSSSDSSLYNELDISQHPNLEYIQLYNGSLFSISDNPISYITLNEEVSPDAVVTATYSVDGVPKTSDYVLDIEFQLKFSDGGAVEQ